MEATNVELYTRYHRLWPFKARYLVPFFLSTNKQAKQKQTPTSWWRLLLSSSLDISDPHKALAVDLNCVLSFPPLFQAFPLGPAEHV